LFLLFLPISFHTGLFPFEAIVSFHFLYFFHPFLFLFYFYLFIYLFIFF
jgi:hypothetical protein